MWILLITAIINYYKSVFFNSPLPVFFSSFQQPGSFLEEGKYKMQSASSLYQEFGPTV